MKRLLVVLLLSLSLGLAVHQGAKADYSVSYYDSSQAQVWALSGGRLAFIFFDWPNDWDVFTTHTYSYAAPTSADLGAGYVLSYYLDYRYSSGGRMYVDVYGTSNNYSWYYLGLYYI